MIDKNLPKQIWIKNEEVNKDLIEDWLVQTECFDDMTKYIRVDIVEDLIKEKETLSDRAG